MPGALTSRSPFAYRPPSGRSIAFLQRAGAGATLVYVGSLALVAFCFSSPLMLAAAGAGVAIAGLASGARPALSVALRYAVPLALLMIAVNVLVSDRGDTVLVHGIDLPLLGQVNVSLESITAGGVIALRVVVGVAAFAVLSACADPDEILKLIRPLARRSALTAALIGRLVPLAASDHRRLSEAGRLRGPAAEPATRAALARRLIGGALDRSLDAAATLELRGYSLPVVRTDRTRRRRRGAAVVSLSGTAIAAVSIAAAIAGLASFSTYPTLELDAGPADLALAVAVPLIASLPVALAYLRRGEARRAARVAGAQEPAHG